MIGQEAQDVERKITAILKILSDSPCPWAAGIFQSCWRNRGIYLGERAVTLPS